MYQPWWEKFAGSFGTVLLGILVFFGSFVVVFIGEGRIDYSKIAETAVSVSQSKSGEDFVYVTGKLKTVAPIGDDYILPGDYVALDRTAEIYSWIEETKEDNKGVEYYSYKLEWANEPKDSSEFHDNYSHENYPPKIKDARTIAEKGLVGDFEIDPGKVQMPSFEKLGLNKDVVKSEYVGMIDGDYLYFGSRTMAVPAVGDERVSYKVVKPGEEATVFGKADGKNLNAHQGEKEKDLYRIFSGTDDDAISTMVEEYKASGWLWRIIGFMVMWAGLTMIFKPLTVVFELIPFVSKLGKSTVGAVTFVVALVLTTITSLLSMVLHNPYGIAAIAAVIVGVIFYFISKGQPATNSAQEKGGGTHPGSGTAGGGTTPIGGSHEAADKTAK